MAKGHVLSNRTTTFKAQKGPSLIWWRMRCDTVVIEDWQGREEIEHLMSHGLMSLLCFWALNVSVALLSMQGQKALGFHQKYLNLCSEDEQRSYGFGTTWGWVWQNFHFWVNYPLRVVLFDKFTQKTYYEQCFLVWTWKVSFVYPANPISWKYVSIARVYGSIWRTIYTQKLTLSCIWYAMGRIGVWGRCIYAKTAYNMHANKFRIICT